MIPAPLLAALEAWIDGPVRSADPYPMFDAVRALAPVVRLRDGRWAITGHDEAEAVLRTPAISRRLAAAQHAAGLRAAAGDDRSSVATLYERWFINLDAPDHTRLRRLASPALRPRVLAAIQPHVDEVIDRLIDELLDDPGPVELKELAYEIPHQVVCRVLGIPARDHDMWRRSVELLADANAVGAPTEHLRAVTDALETFAPYCRALIRTGAGRGDDDLLAALHAARLEDPTFDEDDLVATLMLLIVAGHVTTVNMLSNGLYLLLTHPGQWDRLRDDPTLAGRAVEEALRFEPPARVNLRVAREPVTVGDVTIEPGDVVLIIVPAANRDPRRYADPSTFSIETDQPPHLAFGLGAHFCLGAPLARLEGVSTFEALARRVDLELIEATWSTASSARILEGLQARVARS